MLFRLAITALLMLSLGCAKIDKGSDDAPAGDEKNADDGDLQPDEGLPADVFEMEALGKKLRFKDQFFELSCDPGSIKVFVGAENNCTEVSTELNGLGGSGESVAGLVATAKRWRITSDDDTIDIEVVQKDPGVEEVQIDGKTYQCMYYEGDVYMADGTDVLGNLVLFGEAAASKPSVLNPETVVYIGATSPEVCEALN